MKSADNSFDKHRDRPAMHRHAMHGGRPDHDPVQRQTACDGPPLAQPAVEAGQPALGTVALHLRQKAAAVPFRNDHVVHEARRHPAAPCRLARPMPSLDKHDNPAAKFHGVRSAHVDPLHLAASGMHNPFNPGILKQAKCDTLRAASLTWPSPGKAKCRSGSYTEAVRSE